jgi:hypothetical protein
MAVYALRLKEFGAETGGEILIQSLTELKEELNSSELWSSRYTW